MPNGDSATYESSGLVIPPSFSLSLDEDPEPVDKWEVPKPEFPRKIIRKTGAELKGLMEETNLNALKIFLEKNLASIHYGHIVREGLTELCRDFAPSDIQFTNDMDPDILMKILRGVLEQYQRKFALFDVSLESARILEGSALAAKIDKSVEKVSELLEALQRRVNDAEHNVWDLEEIHKENMELIQAYEGKIIRLFDRIICSQDERYGEEPAAFEETFVGELKKHLVKTMYLNSSFKEELAAEKRTKHSLLQEICRLKERRIFDEQQKMKEIAEIAKDLELDEGIRKLIVEKIKTLTSNPEEIHRAVNEWMNEVHACIGPKQDQIDDLKGEMIYWEDEIAKMTLEYDDSKAQYQQLIDVMTDLDEEINEKLEDLQSKETALQNINRSVQASGPQHDSSVYYDTKTPSQFHLESLSSSPPYYDAKSPSHFRMETPDSLSKSYNSPKFRGGSPHSGDISGSLSVSHDSSPEMFRRGSPGYFPRYSNNYSPISLDSTPPMGLNSSSSSCSSPLHSRTLSMQSYSRERSYVATPGSGILPRPRGKFVTPTQSVTPFISKSQFDYTDPNSKALNIPSGDDLRVQSAFKKSVLMESPMGEEPMLLKIGIDTKPLSQTQSADEIVCDISLDLLPSGHLQHPSPVYTYGTPPALTPTSTRRDGLNTPTETFTKRHYNIRRRVYRPDEYQNPNLHWSPNYLPQEGISPISGFLPSPVYSDKSISWEKSPQRQNVMNKTFEALPGMNRTFDASPARNRTFVASPARNRTFVASPARNRTFVASPARNKTFVAPSPRLMNRTFDRTSPHVMNRMFDASSPHVMNRTFDASSPYVMNKTFDGSPPQVMNRTFNKSSPRAKNRTFHGSSPQVMNKTFDASSPQVLNRTFDASSRHVKNKTFDGSPPQVMNRTFDRSSPRAMNRTSDGSSPRVMNRTFDASSPRVMNKTFEASPPDTMNRTFDKTPSPALKRASLNKTPSPQNRPGVTRKKWNEGGTPDASSHGAMNKTIDASPPDTMNRTFDKTPSPALKRASLNKTPSPQNQSSPHNRTSDRLSPPNKTFDTDSSYDQSMSPKSSRTYSDNSSRSGARSRSPSPGRNATFDHGTSEMNRTFHKSTSRESTRTNDTEEY